MASEGDVFLIPIGDGDYALGQVAGTWNDELYLVVFEIRTGQSEAWPELVVGVEPFLAALSLDAKLWNGDWPIIGNFRDNLEGIAEPMFRVMQNGAPYVKFVTVPFIGLLEKMNSHVYSFEQLPRQL